MKAEGWYRDPYGSHEARWFSEGTPTALVRDGTAESHDEPAGTEFELPLVPITDLESEDGSDLLRAGSEDSVGLTGDGPFQAFGASGGSFS